jgi:hypothetical protein
MTQVKVKFPLQPTNILQVFFINIIFHTLPSSRRILQTGVMPVTITITAPLCTSTSPTSFFPIAGTIPTFSRSSKRRAKVVGVSPDEESLHRLVGSILMDMNEEGVTGRVINHGERTVRQITA